MLRLQGFLREPLGDGWRERRGGSERRWQRKRRGRWGDERPGWQREPVRRRWHERHGNGGTAGTENGGTAGLGEGGAGASVGIGGENDGGSDGGTVGPPRGQAKLPRFCNSVRMVRRAQSVPRGFWFRGADVTDVWVVGRTEAEFGEQCVPALGRSPLVEHSAPVLGPWATVMAIWGSDPDDVWFVGDNDGSAIRGPLESGILVAALEIRGNPRASRRERDQHEQRLGRGCTRRHRPLGRRRLVAFPERSHGRLERDLERRQRALGGGSVWNRGALGRARTPEALLSRRS